ncbi:hypothetical protein HYALB_00000599 [Hymenoscyphus albidus]|uniref:Alpha-galactosidase n=1 Tax=Hymenoscyphus albidus TaxID=595503 RepID=A0A9N9Q826_9HELO|nr:hypothetical protein HYALB_00000599 [Hymenoscyphus albidus]
MSASIVCEPLLGQTTVLAGDKAVITALIHPEEGPGPWEVAVWHNNSESREWNQLELKTNGGRAQKLYHESHQLSSGIIYTGYLRRIPQNKNPNFSFTIKYRSSGQEWKWINEQSNVGDAQVIFQWDSGIPECLSYFLKNADNLLHIEDCVTNSPLVDELEDTRLWSISSTVPAATEKSSYTRINIGQPLQMIRWFCLVRESRPWLCPRQGDAIFSPNEDVILVSILREDGLHLVLLALSLQDILTVITHDGKGNIAVLSRNERQVPGTAHILAAVGKSFENANRAVIGQAKILVDRYRSETRTQFQSIVKSFEPRNLETWYDGFAYCTWNGLGQNLTDEKLYQALETMSEAGISFSTLIIDDNWQSIDNSGKNNFHHRWKEFEADRKTFPQGLKHTISTIRKRYPSLKHIAVWHGIIGYWNGISPDETIARTYETKILKKHDDGFFGGGSVIAVDACDAHRLYDDFYRFLADCGVDSVKTDTQSLLDQLENPEDRARFMTAYQDAWMVASLRHFSARAISCMSQFPQALFYSQLLSSLPKLMVRNSEDFFPDDPTSHPWHIFCNAHTNVFTQHLNVLPDWDMFQTSHEYSAFHAAGRCISGGPIYFTDKPGEHNIGLIKQMTAKTLNSTIILRPKVAKTNYVYTSKNEPRLLRISTSTIHTNTPMLGVFNVGDEKRMEIVTLNHFSHILPAQEYIIRAHTSGFMSSPISQAKSTSPLLLSLDVKGYEILTAYPLDCSSSPTEGVKRKIAIIGLVDKMSGAAAVLGSSIQERPDGLDIRVSLKAMGLLGICIFSDSTNVEIPIVRMCNVQLMSTMWAWVHDENMIKIDMEKAWEVVNETATSREITVDLSIK